MKRLPPTLYLAWFIALALGGWQLTVLVAERNSLDEGAAQGVRTLARLVGEHADSIMDSTELMLENTLGPVSTAYSASDPAAAAMAIHELLEAAAVRTAAVDNLFFADARGTVLASSLKRTHGGSMSGEPYFEEFRDDPRDRTVAATVRGRSTGRWGLVLARPLQNGEGRLVGVLAAHIGLESTFLSLYRTLGISPGTAISVWNDHGVLLLRQPFVESLIGRAMDGAVLASVISGGRFESVGRSVSPSDGQEQMQAILRIQHHPLIVGVSQSRDEYLAPWTAMLWRTLLLVVALLSFCWLLARYADKRSKSEGRFKKLIDAAPIGVVCFESDASGAPTAFAANQAALRQLPPCRGLPTAIELEPLSLAEPLAKAAEQGDTWRGTGAFQEDSGNWRHVDLRLFGVGRGEAGMLIEDATERLSAEAKLRDELTRWRVALEETEHGVREWNLATGQMHFSERWLSQLGYSANELAPTLEQWEKQVHPDDLKSCQRLLQRHLDGLSAVYRSEHRMRCRDEGYLCVLERGRVVDRAADGRPLRMVLTQADISPLRQLEDNLALWGQVFAGALEGIIITDSNARIVEVNPAYCATSGFERAELLGKNPNVMQSGHQNADFYRSMWAHLREHGSWQGELLNRRADGSFFAQVTHIKTICDREGKPIYYVGFTSDVSALRESQQRLEHLHRHDALTGLPNRQQLAEDLRLAIAMAQRNRGLLAVCALDLDHFKPINERWGPEQGDRLLIEVTARLRHQLGADDVVARLGGDEFVLLLGGLASPMECDSRIQRILARLREPFAIAGANARLTASVGATLYPLDGADPDTLLRHADQALYAAKQDGGDTCHLFDPEQDRRLRMHRRAVCDVRAALASGEMRLRYQPKVRLDSGAVIGVEALLRWQHPERGLLLPADFLAQIDDEALLTRVGEWCLETAVEQTARWHLEGHTIPVSVNVPATQILAPGFASHLRSTLDRYPDLAAGLLEIEILESAALEDLPRVVDLMESCTSLGVTFALDDFGTGYASLTYLKHLPAATLKIDQSFVRDMLEDGEHRAIIEGVLSLSRVFGRTAIAEGAESIEHGVELIKLGATHAQGFAIAGALPADELPEWIANWRNPPEWTRASWAYRNQGAPLQKGA